MHGPSGHHRPPNPKCQAIAAIDAGDEFGRELNRSRVEILEGGRVTMSYGCPNGHTDGIEQGCRLTVWLPVNPDTGETDTDTLDGRETDNWSHGYYYCPTCGENFDHL